VLPKKVLAIITILLILVIIFSVFATAASDNLFLFSKDLSVKELGSPATNIDHSFNVTEPGGGFQGTLTIQVNHHPGSLTSIWFDQFNNFLGGYVVDSISLKFNPGLGNLVNVYFEGNYPAVPTTFSQHKSVTTITLRGMEIYRGGSGTIKFIAESFKNTTLTVSGDVVYHKTSLLSLTSLRAHFSVNVKIP